MGSNFRAGGDPISQKGNVNRAAGQFGEIRFLAGTFGGATERSCKVKKGKALFFPIYNGIWWTPLDPKIPEDCTDLTSPDPSLGTPY